jgi:hypothetical protein
MNDLAFVSMKLSLLTRLQIILHICFWCFTLRILLLSVKVYSRLESGVNTGFIYSLPIYLWFTLNNWVPNVIPVRYPLSYLSLILLPLSALSIECSVHLHDENHGVEGAKEHLR